MDDPCPHCHRETCRAHELTARLWSDVPNLDRVAASGDCLQHQQNAALENLRQLNALLHQANTRVAQLTEQAGPRFRLSEGNSVDERGTLWELRGAVAWLPMDLERLDSLQPGDGFELQCGVFVTRLEE